MIIFVDTETTGLEKEKEDIIQIAVIAYEYNEENNCLEEEEIRTKSFCKNSDVPISFDAMATHNILEKHIKNAPHITSSSAYQTLLFHNFSHNFLVAHNAPFDVGMIEKYLKLNYKIIDTLKVAKFHFKRPCSLQYLKHRMGFSEKYEETIFHDALSDTSLLVDIFKEFLKFYTPEKMISICNSPCELENLPLGKYKGKPFQEVFEEDPNYIVWMAKNIDDEDCKFTAAKLLQEKYS